MFIKFALSLFLFTRWPHLMLNHELVSCKSISFISYVNSLRHEIVIFCFQIVSLAIWDILPNQIYVRRKSVAPSSEIHPQCTAIVNAFGCFVSSIFSDKNEAFSFNKRYFNDFRFTVKLVRTNTSKASHKSV